MVDGNCEPGYEGVRDALERSLTTGADVGASVAVLVDGEFKVDLWGGTADLESGYDWQRDTVVNVYSTGKTMVNLIAHQLADRGQLDFDAPVTRYWPEFGAAGKEGVLVRHLLGHTSGVSGWDVPITEENIGDWEYTTSALAAQAPWWQPGTASGYHACSQGHLVGEVVRRVTGATLGTYFADEIAGPIGADFQFGLKATDYDRAARLIPPEPLALELAPESVAYKTLTNPGGDVEWTRQDWWRGSELPAVNGHGNARSIALVQSAFANGGTVNGVRLLSADSWKRVREQQASGVDLVLGFDITFGLGYAISSEGLPFDTAPSAFFWGGFGGSLVVIDPEIRMTFAFAMNKMQLGTVGDSRSASMLAAAYGAVAAARSIRR